MCIFTRFSVAPRVRSTVRFSQELRDKSGKDQKLSCARYYTATDVIDCRTRRISNADQPCRNYILFYGIDFTDKSVQLRVVGRQSNRYIRSTRSASGK